MQGYVEYSRLSGYYLSFSMSSAKFSAPTTYSNKKDLPRNVFVLFNEHLLQLAFPFHYPHTSLVCFHSYFVIFICSSVTSFEVRALFFLTEGSRILGIPSPVILEPCPWLSCATCTVKDLVVYS